MAKDAYPIAGPTYLLVPDPCPASNKTETLKNFIQYLVTQGQNEAAALSYAKIPDRLQQADQNLFSQVGCGAPASQANLGQGGATQ